MSPHSAVMMFWDYDTQWGADRSRSPGGPKPWGPLEFENTEALLELHAEFEIPACFAVVGASAMPGDRPYHDPDQIRRIHAAGHEIASHSFKHEWIPGLDRTALLSTLKRSKESLEQCIGAEVTAFVPPYNQPFDYPQRWAFSVSERRGARKVRTDLQTLCAALQESGYTFCRVVYQPVLQQIAERVTGRSFDRPVSFETIAGVMCVRLNTRGGFDERARAMVNRCVAEGGVAVVYGHPHSINTDGPQHISHLRTLLAEIREARDRGNLVVQTPAMVLHASTSLTVGNER